jgi:hypothetical protein
MTGEGTELVDEVVLECKQRRLPYNIVRVGRIIEDGECLADNLRERSDTQNSVAVAQADEGFARPLYASPIVVSGGRRYEVGESTRVSVASEAVLRAVSHPHR